MKYDAVVFDLFGTLVDSHVDEDYREAQRRIAAIFGVSWDRFHRAWRTIHDDRDMGRFGSLEDDFASAGRVLGIEATTEQIVKAMRIRVDAYRRMIRVRTDAVSTLTELKARGHRIVLLSNCAHEIPMVWDDLPFAPLMDAVIFSCQVGVMKPDPRIYELACERISITPDRCLYVGDGGSRELTGALQAGMHPLLIRVPYDAKYGPDRIDAIEWTGPVVSSLTEILSLAARK